MVGKYPEMIFRVRFLRAIYPDAKIIFLMRNGWDTVYSIARYAYEHSLPHVKGRADWWGIGGRKWQLLIAQVLSTENDLSAIRSVADGLERHEDKAAVEWILTMREGLCLVESFPGQIYMIRYEDLVASPKHTLHELLEFCELNKDDDMITYATKVLKPVPARKSHDLHPNIYSAFIETMRRAGYSI